MAKEWEKQLEQVEAKKAKTRDNRLKKIQALLTDNVKEISPQDADRYKIVYKQVQTYYSGIFGKVKVLPYDSPVYGFFLVSKSNPTEAYTIMNLFSEDIDKRVKIEDMKTYYDIPASKTDIREGVEYFKTKKARNRFNVVRLALEKS